MRLWELSLILTWIPTACIMLLRKSGWFWVVRMFFLTCFVGVDVIMLHKFGMIFVDGLWTGLRVFFIGASSFMYTWPPFLSFDVFRQLSNIFWALEQASRNSQNTWTYSRHCVQITFGSLSFSLSEIGKHSTIFFCRPSSANIWILLLPALEQSRHKSLKFTQRYPPADIASLQETFSAGSFFL